jgi:hypothetical protein
MPSGTGEGDNLKRFCLRPSEGWEKVAEGRMRALQRMIQQVTIMLYIPLSGLK